MRDSVIEVMAEHRPGHPVASVRSIGSGEDHLAFEVDGDLIVRFRRDGDAVRSGREALVLDAVGSVSTIPVPQVMFTDVAHACLAYRKVPGVPLLGLQDRLAPDDLVHLAGQLGRFMMEINGIPTEDLGLDAVDDESPETERSFAAMTFRSVRDRIPHRHRAAVADFLSTPAPSASRHRALCHNDLGIEHVLVDPTTWTVTGIIDWGDADLVDPARDLGRILRDLGPDALELALTTYRHDSVERRDRAWFFARCGLLEDLEYGLDDDRAAYVDKSLAALPWLFA